MEIMGAAQMPLLCVAAWLVTHNKCWTVDRLARRGLPHPEFCPLCDQEEETIDHLLVHCVFASLLVQSIQTSCL